MFAIADVAELLAAFCKIESEIGILKAQSAASMPMLSISRSPEESMPCCEPHCLRLRRGRDDDAGAALNSERGITRVE